MSDQSQWRTTSRRTTTILGIFEFALGGHQTANPWLRVRTRTEPGRNAGQDAQVR
ncbi:hypothetical protein LINGRAHAP2_LOCUS8330, partial [Linum grandiflorum]